LGTVNFIYDFSILGKKIQKAHLNSILRQTNENKMKIVECISKIGAIMLNDRDAK
jgi:hypothetical protein